MDDTKVANRKDETMIAICWTCKSYRRFVLSDDQRLSQFRCERCDTKLRPPTHVEVQEAKRALGIASEQE